MRLLLIVGPPAVGKMSIGGEIAARSSFRLFHNHHTIEPLIEIFGYGTPAFEVLNLEFRRRIIEEAAEHRLDLIFTLVWALDDPTDLDYIQKIVTPYQQEGSEIWVLELAASLETRLQRNRSESRLAAKPSKRDMAWSDENVRGMEILQMNSDVSKDRNTPAEKFLQKHPHLRIETDGMDKAEIAEIALRWLSRNPE